MHNFWETNTMDECSHVVNLDNSFVKEKLDPKPSDAIPLLRKKTTNVPCPLCQTGLLELTKAEPLYGPPPSKLHHVGNALEYTCSKCGAKFLGKYQWMSFVSKYF